MSRSTNNPWLHRFAVITAICVVLLIGLGGVVTSKGAGMAVPDWPTTYGYNMFLFPVSQWVGGIFYEHTHRLFATFIGLLTVVQAVWIWLRDARPWMRWLGVVSVVGVVAQGVLGGLRVVLFKAELGIVHATVAQVFLVMMAFIAVATSAAWGRRAGGMDLVRAGAVQLRPWLIAATAAVFVQLVMGAAMRHRHNGLAVPDFPLAHGSWWPATDGESIDRYNRGRLDVREFGSVTAYDIRLHMAHRIGALVVLGLVGAVWIRSRRYCGAGSVLGKGSMGWMWLVAGQGVLGAMTVWSNKAADVATMHVVLGALILTTGGMLTAIACKFTVEHEGAVVHSPGGQSVGELRKTPAGVIS